MLLFKLYASCSITLHPASGKAVDKCTAHVNKYKRKGQRQKKSHSVLYAIVSEWSYSLTEHVQADFLGFLSCLVLGDASVISFIHFLDIFYYQFWTILVQAVLITRFKDNVVTAAEGKRKKKKTWQGSHHKCLLTQLRALLITFLTHWQWSVRGFISGKKQLVYNQGWQSKKKKLLCCMPLRTSRNKSTAFVCLSSHLAFISDFKKVLHQFDDDLWLFSVRIFGKNSVCMPALV